MLKLSMFLATTLSFSTSADAAVYRVDPDGTGDYGTIQTAIDASRNGDVIELSPGTFSGPGNRDLRFQGKAIIIGSISGDPRSSIIDCDNMSVGATFSSGETPETVLRGVTIYRGRGTVTGGAYIERADPTIERCIFLENTCTNGPGGGGINAFDSQSLIVDCRFEKNYTNLGGAAIFCDGANPRVLSCTMLDNVGQCCSTTPVAEVPSRYCDINLITPAAGVARETGAGFMLRQR